MKRVFEELVLAASRFGVGLGEFQLESLERYAEFMLSYREANVTGVRELDVLVREHFVDSLSCFLVPEVSASRYVVDIGSGGGLPGVVVATAAPGSGVDLIESTGKKCLFLERAVAEVSLKNVTVRNVRVEEFGRERKNRELYDVALVRAVAELPVLAEYGLPLIRKGGVLVAMKSEVSSEEMNAGQAAAQELGATLREVLPVPEVEGVFEGFRRNLVVIEKVSGTPRRFPRQVGVPKKQPLGSRA